MQLQFQPLVDTAVERPVLPAGARAPARVVGTLVCAAAATAAAALLGVAEWPQAGRTFDFGGLTAAAILVSLLAANERSRERGLAPPAFVVEFAALLLLGPNAAMLVAGAGIVTPWILSAAPRPLRRRLLDLVSTLLAIQIGGAAYRLLGGTPGGFVWPLHGLPIVAALCAYFLVRGALIERIVPRVTKGPAARPWREAMVAHAPSYAVGAGVAVVVAEAIDHRLWEIAPVAAIPLYFSYQLYCDYIGRLQDERRRREVIEFLDEGMAVLDDSGRVTLWNDTLERILDCPRSRAEGRTVSSAIPALARTELPRAIADALLTRATKIVGRVPLRSGGVDRVLQVKVVPVTGGLALLWSDITERNRAEQALTRSRERLALAAEGANDGLWEWDLRTQEFYVSSRWSGMMGLAEVGSISRADDWFDRVHPEDLAPLREALDAHLTGQTDHFQHEHRLRHEEGSYRRFLCRGVAVRGAQRRPTRIAGSLTDTTEQVMAQEQLRSAGFLDPLTGLCNRAVFVEGIGRRLDDLKHRRAGGWFAVLYLDLDRFKIVNDSLGHLVGDELLVAVSRRLETCLRQGDALARLGGDEFAILLNGLGDEGQANAIAFRIQEALSAPFSIGGREVFTSASIGIAFGRAQYSNPEELMRDADTAMYHAKARGKARHELFDADMHARVRDRLGLENDLRHAVSGNDFEVHYQPIVSLASGMCVGFESLVRWNRNGAAVSPATFIPLAEELGLIEALGTWVLQEACSTFAEWQRRFPENALACITVNVSSRQLMQQGFPRLVEQAVARARLRPADLRLEITETALMDSPNEAAEVLRELRAFGVKIYLDDFGTGYSSLSHLHKLPVDALKIDRSFVKSLSLPDRPAIVESILALARTLNTSVVAEGIEDEMQARELQRLGCTHAQGYLFSRPLSARSVEALMIANRPLGPAPSEAAGAQRTWSTSFDWPETTPA